MPGEFFVREKPFAALGVSIHEPVTDGRAVTGLSRETALDVVRRTEKLAE
jgi:hypothetical protein